MTQIRRINSEQPYKDMWNTFVYFESEPTTKEFLQKKYEKLGYDEAFKYAFQNTSKFIYFIKQSKEYFHSADISNILVKPVLIYYGMMNLIKAIVLTKDPNYPRNTSVLRHGITTRKLKKNNFSFRDDEVKIQKEGLLPHFYTMLTNFSNEKIEGNKYQVRELLSLLPDLHQSYQRLFKHEMLFPINIELNSHLEENNKITLVIPKRINQFYDSGTSQLCRELTLHNHNKKDIFEIKRELNSVDSISIIYKSQNVDPNKSNIFNNPMLLQDLKGHYYIKPITETRFVLPELMIYYMIMYNLGMLCRYETELWGDIIFSFTSEDMYIINEFINLSLRKFPNLVLNNLFDEIIIFDNF